MYQSKHSAKVARRDIRLEVLYFTSRDSAGIAFGFRLVGYGRFGSGGILPIA